MAQILLTHPVHGSKFALSDAEVEHDEKHGWSRYTDDTPKAATSKGKKATVKVERAIEQPVEETPEQPAEPTIEQPNDTPEFLAPVSEESEGK